jgi:starch synthase
MNLPAKSDFPLLGMIARLVEQKGFDYLIPALERLLYEDPPVQIVLLGSGDPEYGSRLHFLQKRYPKKMGFVNGYDNELSHLIEAGSDFFMMPSLFEPCGLNQLYSLAYGTLPIVRETGGLKDTVVGLAPDHGNAPPDATAASGNKGFATGISFVHPDPEGCYWALKQAITLYLDHPKLYGQMQQQAMKQLFPWEETAGMYEILFENLLKKSKIS